MNSKIILILLALTTFTTTKGQINLDVVKISGQFKNINNQKIFIHFDSESDTIDADMNGNFDFRPNEIKRPVLCTMRIGNMIRFNFYLAPGYNLNIQADAIKESVFLNTLKFSGIGSKTNLFWKKEYELQSKWKINPLTDKWYDIRLESFAEKGINSLKLDSFLVAINKIAFTNNDEPYNSFLKRAAEINVKFTKVFYLFAYSNWNELTPEQTKSIIDSCIEPHFFDNLNYDEYINLAPEYKDVIRFQYLNYVLSTKEIQNSDNILKTKLEIADSLYKGKTKDYVLSELISRNLKDQYNKSEISLCYSYISKICNKEIKEQLEKQYEICLQEIDRVGLGKLAPIFNLPDLNGKMYSLTDFLGKVVYIDLWASWCGNCRKEMPFLKELYDEYKNNSSIQILCIATQDEAGRDSRLEFLQKINLDCIQLEDKDDFIWDNYKPISIPRYILIDKEGKIISFDAVSPSNKTKIRKIINNAIEK